MLPKRRQEKGTLNTWWFGSTRRKGSRQAGMDRPTYMRRFALPAITGTLFFDGRGTRGKGWGEKVGRGWHGGHCAGWGGEPSAPLAPLVIERTGLCLSLATGGLCSQVIIDLIRGLWDTAGKIAIREQRDGHGGGRDLREEAAIVIASRQRGRNVWRRPSVAPLLFGGLLERFGGVMQGVKGRRGLVGGEVRVERLAWQRGATCNSWGWTTRGGGAKLQLKWKTPQLNTNIQKHLGIT